MDAKDVMVHQPLNQVERSPPHQYKAEVESPTRGQPTLTPGMDAQCRSGEDAKPGEKVERAIGKGVDLECVERVGFEPLDMADQVVPLQQLVQDDPVDEAAQPDAHEQADGPGWRKGAERCWVR